MKKIGRFASIVGVVLTVRFAEEVYSSVALTAKENIENGFKKVKNTMAVRKFRRNLDTDLRVLLNGAQDDPGVAMRRENMRKSQEGYIELPEI